MKFLRRKKKKRKKKFVSPFLRKLIPLLDFINCNYTIRPIETLQQFLRFTPLREITINKISLWKYSLVQLSSSNLKNYFHIPFLIKYSNFQSLGNKNFNSFELLTKIFINYIGLAQFQLAHKNFEFFVERSHCIVQHTIFDIYPDTWINITCCSTTTLNRGWTLRGRGGEGERASFDEDSPIKDNKRQPRLDTQRTNRLILTSWRTWGGHPTLLRSLPSWIMAASLSRGNWRSSSSRGEDSRAETIFIRMQISSSFFILYIQYLYKYNANLNTELIGK